MTSLTFSEMMAWKAVRIRSREKNREKDRRYFRSYRMTRMGVANTLRSSWDYSRQVSLILAETLLDRRTRCTICGIPLYWLRLMKFWPYGGARNNYRLTVDHIEPNGSSTLENTRPLCYSCNARRGHAERTDKEVLRWMRTWYERNFAPRFLWWLNTSPGVGGTLNRNKYTERRDRRLYGEESTD
jgi:hypothetical protein